MIEGGTTLAHRLERYRSATQATDREVRRPFGNHGRHLAEELAAAVDGEIVVSSEGTIVRREEPTRPVPVDRDRLAGLPGQPPPHVPLVCLDTETTGLATAAGTIAFLIGLGWWEGDRFRQVQLLLPDHADERALLSALAASIAPNAWLVTYNGRGFDWPLLVARFRLARRAAPPHDGHLDLLPIVRRLFRHRMTDARLQTAEAQLLGLHRVGDVEGWEIPGRYLEFLRSGSAAELVQIVRHNDQDVRSLAWLLVHLEVRFGDAGRRADAEPGDLAGLARAFARERRLGEALDCLDSASGRISEVAAWQVAVPGRSALNDEPWWSPRRPADFGGAPRRAQDLLGPPRTAALVVPWTSERISMDRAHLLRRLGRFSEAVEIWDSLAAGSGRGAIVASIELAKLQEHRVRDRGAALRSVLRGLAIVERRRRLGRPEVRLEADLLRRVVRLRARAAGRGGRRSAA